MPVQTNADVESVVTALFGGILAKSTCDPVFRERLKSNPTAVLSDMGLTIPPTITVTVEDSVPGGEPTPCRENALVLILPAEGARALSDGELDSVSGGGPLSGLFFGARYPLALVQAVLDPDDTRTIAQKAASLGEGVRTSWNDDRLW